MEFDYIKEEKIKELSDEERNMELLINIVETRENLKKAHKNFEFAESDLIDYYSYDIKANQANLDYLIKKAKERGLVVDCKVGNKLIKEQNVG